MSSKQIWVPSSEMKVTVQDGAVYISESMVMKPRPVDAPKTGFGK